MNRLLLATMVCLVANSGLMAALTSSLQDFSTVREENYAQRLIASAPVNKAPQATAAVTPDPNKDFIITEQTEVQCNGRPCRYADIPRGAIITLLEVATDGKTVVRVHFKAAK